MTNHSAPASNRHRVVVIGSGFGGLFATKALRHADVDVTMIAKTTHHLFQPLLYQVATGILSEGEIAPATRERISTRSTASRRPENSSQSLTDFGSTIATETEAAGGGAAATALPGLSVTGSSK